MSIIHTGIAVSSVDIARRIFCELFGFSELYRFKIESEHAKTLFTIDSGAEIIVFDAGNTRIEVFIPDPVSRMPISFNHLCIGVDDVEVTVRKAELEGFEVRRISKESRIVTFIVDIDGNLYEVKQNQ